MPFLRFLHSLYPPTMNDCHDTTSEYEQSLQDRNNSFQGPSDGGHAIREDRCTTDRTDRCPAIGEDSDGLSHPFAVQPFGIHVVALSVMRATGLRTPPRSVLTAVDLGFAGGTRGTG